MLEAATLEFSFAYCTSTLLSAMWSWHKNNVEFIGIRIWIPNRLTYVNYLNLRQFSGGGEEVCLISCIWMDGHIHCYFI